MTLTERGEDLRIRAASMPAALFDRLGMSIVEIETLRNVLTGLIEHAREQNNAPDLVIEDVRTVASVAESERRRTPRRLQR